MPHIQIKSINGAVLHEGDYADTRAALVAAVRREANLYGADLREANLYGAYLREANLSGANLSGADLSGAILSDGITATAAFARRATREDGYEFFLWPTSAGWRVVAGCRFFTMDEAWRHWEQTRANTPLGDESHDILTMFELHIQRVEAEQ